MYKRLIVLGILGFLVTMVLGGCANLKHLTEFSESSITSMEKFEDLSSDFPKICLEDCQQKNISKLNIHTKACECLADAKADSITRLIYTTALDYFYALSDISKNELTNYKTSALTKTLSTGDFGPVTLNESDVSAYSNISGIILRAFTDAYRRNKIKEYVARSNEPLQVLLHFLDFNLSGNLKGKLEVQKSSLKNFYFDLVMDKKLSVYERTKFAEDYYERVARLDAKQQELDDYSEMIRTIAEGHATLNANINKLAEQEVRMQLKGYGSRLRNGLFSFTKTNR